MIFGIITYFQAGVLALTLSFLVPLLIMAISSMAFIKERIAESLRLFKERKESNFSKPWKGPEWEPLGDHH